MCAGVATVRSNGRVPTIRARLAAGRYGGGDAASLRSRFQSRPSVTHPAPTTAQRALRAHALHTTRLDVALNSPVDLKADPWQRMIAVGSILSVVVLAIGLYITNAANREQQRLAMQGQITDRFSKAVE